MSAEPGVARVQPASPTSLFLMGVSPGRTTVIATSDAGTAIVQYDVTVTPSGGAARPGEPAPAAEKAGVTPAMALAIQASINQTVSGASAARAKAVGDDIVLERWPANSSPTGEPLIEDSSHAAVTIEFTTRVERELAPLAAVVPAATWDAAAALDTGFANTLVDLATSDDDGAWQFPGDMDGTPNQTVYARAQESCEGWGLLAPHLAPVYTRCLDVTFGDTGDGPSSITPANLAALGWMTPR